MPVGGAETLLVNMVRRFDRARINPMIGCLKQKDELGEKISAEIPVFENLIRHKFDARVLLRLRRLFRSNSIQAVITVGAGDKMFWGRLAARISGAPVILSALHSTGWPDGVGKMNRLLTPITDGFIAVAEQHAEFQKNHERFPAEKVFLIPNGIDTEQFRFDEVSRSQWRKKLNIPATAPVISIVAALRPEKNHSMFLRVAAKVIKQRPEAHFAIAGDGPERLHLQRLANSLGLAQQIHFIGSTPDVVGVLSMSDLFALTSFNEASPVSIMEALSCQRPVVAPAVGSINETVIEGKTGFLIEVNNVDQAVRQWLRVLDDPSLASRLGEHGRQHVIRNCSLEKMTLGYTELVENILVRKAASGNVSLLTAASNQQAPHLTNR